MTSAFVWGEIDMGLLVMCACEQLQNTSCNYVDIVPLPKADKFNKFHECKPISHTRRCENVYPRNLANVRKNI